MRRSTLTMGIGVLAFACAGAASVASAADPMSAPELPFGMIGVIDVHAGLGAGTENDISGAFVEDTDWNFHNFGGSGRLSIPFDQFLLQLDAWFNSWGGTDTFSNNLGGSGSEVWSVGEAGMAAHVALPLDHGLIGGMISVGTDVGSEFTAGRYATTALEGMADFDNWRIYGQVGFTSAIGGMAADDNASIVYASGVVGYYLDPNLVVSGNLGVNQWSWEAEDEREVDLTWGARVEKKLDDMPVSAYLAYQGWSWAGDDGFDDSWSGSEHGIFAGIRVALGDGTLRDLDHRVGLSDMNPAYGDIPH